MTMKIFFALTTSVTLAAGLAGAARAPSWEFAGPTTYTARGDEPGAPSLSSAGAAQDVKRGANGTWFLASTNGGVWRTKNLRENSLGNIKQQGPRWENVLDGQPVTCSAISALHVSAHNPRRVYAGCGGATSSMEGSDWNVMNSGDWSGVMQSHDGGDTWAMVESFPMNYYVTALLEVDEKGSLLVAAQSNLHDRDDGGMWTVSVSGEITRVSHQPTFTLTQLTAAGDNGILATHARDAKNSISISGDGGKTWGDAGKLPWQDGAIPFYTCATEMSDGSVVVAGLTRLNPFPNATSSQFFIQRAGMQENSWAPLDQPTSMDEDAMPKDRMAVLADPLEADTLYVAGNAGALAWRVNVSGSGSWTKMWDRPDVPDGSIPHGDCRNYAWETAAGSGASAGDRLVLVSDGGVFARTSPRKPGGVWVSLNGNYASMELLSAHYDNRGGRFVAGAQDNCAQVTVEHATPDDVAVGFVEGDGTGTCIDNVANPARLFGTTQFLGVGAIDIDPSVDQGMDGDDDDDCGGLCFAQGDKFIGVPLAKYFPAPSSFPYFVTPYTLNSQDTSQLVFWANGTEDETNDNFTRSGFYAFHLPHDGSITSKDDIGPPTAVAYTAPSDGVVLDFVAGGYTNGKSDPSLIVAVTAKHLLYSTGGKMVSLNLPCTFASPVPMEFDSQTGARILGPVTHGRTVSLSVSPADSNIIAVTGWTSVLDNEGAENVWVTTDGGVTWQNITSNLREATGVVGKVRPGGLLIVDLLENNARAVLVGTSNGVQLAFLKGSSEDRASFAFDLSQVTWKRFGSEDEFPIVLTAKITHEVYSDTLVAATFGRGIYVIKNAAKKALLTQMGGDQTDLKPELSSAAFFPPQM